MGQNPHDHMPDPEGDALQRGLMNVPQQFVVACPYDTDTAATTTAAAPLPRRMPHAAPWTRAAPGRPPAAVEDLASFLWHCSMQCDYVKLQHGNATAVLAVKLRRKRPHWSPYSQARNSTR